MPRIGMLWANSAQAEQEIGLVAAFHKGMAELGYVDGRTMIVEERFADGSPQRLDNLAAELVGLNVDLIVTGANGADAAARATKVIPIVSATTADPVGEGLAASLAHPGGNVTGNAVFFPQMMAKRLELLKQALPSLTRAGVLTPDRAPIVRFTFEVMSESAKALGVELELFEASDAATYDAAFAKASANGFGGFVIRDPPIFFRDAGVIAALALKHRILAGGAPICARSGGLFGYAVIFPELFRKAATFVDKILKGAKAGDIPFEQATKFETVVNLKTARALGVDIPATVLAAAAEVIE
ncbi:MAG: ABC transporter substrate-binding protein [Pseudomonadota bacterium]|nr:ABC transporter substrate-binding protein [Pseudomonadota bacterium]